MCALFVVVRVFCVRARFAAAAVAQQKNPASLLPLPRAKRPTQRPPPLPRKKQKQNKHSRIKTPSDAQWKALQYLHREAGTRFIIGIPLAHKNKTLVDNFTKAAHAWLPRKALVGLELGNEPSYWACTGAGGWDRNNHFVPGWQPYVDYFHSVAKRASGCDAMAPGARVADPLLMGPAWDDTNTLQPELLEPIARNGACYLKALTVHYYVSCLFGEGARSLARVLCAVCCVGCV